MPPRGQGRVRDTQDDARPDSANTQAGDNLRQDAYPGRQPVERVERQAINSIRSQNFDNPFDRLDQARAAWHQGGFEAAVPHYFAAIDAADRIDQTEVAAERKRLKTQLNSERDPAKRRELVQYDMTLHDMQRAPGVVRANLGLAYLRNGRQAEGVRMLLEAQRLDPEMAADPNFQRHLEMLDQAGVPDGRRQYEQPIDRGGTQPRDQRGGQPADRRTQSAGERTQPTDQGSGNPTGERGQQPGDQRGGLPTDQGTQQPTDRKTQSTDGTGTQPTDQVTLPSGNNRPDAQTFDNPFVHIQKANEALVKAGTLSPEIKAEYEAAIKAADSIDRKYLLEQAKPLQEALVKAYPQETQQKVATLEQERNAMFQKLPQETQTKLKELDAKFAAATTDAEREAIKKQIKELAPDLAKKQEEIDALTAQPRAILEQLKLIESMMNASALARFAYAEALRKTGDKENAKKLLEEVAKLDPSAAKDEKFQAAAKDVGLAVPSEGQVATKPEGQVATQPEAQTRDKPEGQVEQPTAGAPQIDNGTFDLLQKAHETNEKQGFAAAKPLYEQAIAAAGGIDQAKIDQQLKEAEAKLKTTDEQAKTLRAQLPADKQQKFAELETQLSKATTQEAVQPILGQMLEVAPDLTRKMAEQADQQQSVFALTQIKHAPFTATFQFGLAQHNAGDVAGGKATLQKAAAMDPEAAQEPVFKAAMSLIDKPDKITDEALKQAAASQGGGSSGGVRGDSSGSPAIDDPTDHIRAAMAHQEKGNAKSAEEEWKKAIAAADTLLATPGASERLKAALQQAEQELAQAKAKQDPTKPDTLLAASEAQKKVDGLKEFMSLPALARQQAAIFYLENGKADEAKALLEQALQKDPSLATQERFKKLAEVARDNSRGTLEKSLAFLKKAKDEIISDGGAGMVGLAVSAVTPGKYLKVAAGIAAGGLTKHGLNMALGSDQTSLGRNMLWGGVDALAFMSGAGIQRRLMTKFEAGLTGNALKDMAAKGGIAEAEKLVLLEGKSGFNGLRAVTELLTKQAEAKQATATAALKEAMGAASWYKKPLLWAEAHRAGGSYAIAGVGSFGYHGVTELSRIGSVDPKTGKTITTSDALTAWAALGARDTIIGGTALWGGRALISNGYGLTQAVRNAEFRAGLGTAWRTAPWYEKPYSAIAHLSGGAQRFGANFGSQALQGYRTAAYEAASLQGSRFSYAYPFLGSPSAANLTTLRNLGARTFWSRYKIDAASIGATSLVYRGTHEAAKVGSADPETGKTYSIADAALNTGAGTLQDAAVGPFIVAGVRSFGGFLKGDPLRVEAPKWPSWKTVSADGVKSMSGHYASSFGIAGIGSFGYHGLDEFSKVGKVDQSSGKAISTYDAVANTLVLGARDTVIGGAAISGLRFGGGFFSKPVEFVVQRTAQFLGSNKVVVATGRAIGTGGTLFSPRLYEAYGSWEKMDEYEKVLDAIPKELKDKAPAVNADPPRDAASVGTDTAPKQPQGSDTHTEPPKDKTDGARPERTQPGSDSTPEGGLPE